MSELRGSDRWQRFPSEEVVLIRIREERGVGEDDGDGAGDGVAVAVQERKLLEQEAVAVRLPEQTEGFLVPVLQRNEVSVLPAKPGVLPAVGVKREILRQRRRRRIVAADEVDDESDVHEAVVRVVGGGGVLVEQAPVR